MFYFYKKCKRGFLVLRPSTSADAIDPAINRSDCKLNARSDLSFLQWHLAKKTSIFLLLVFVLFLYQVEAAALVLRPSRSIDRSIVDYKVRSRVVFSSTI